MQGSQGWTSAASPCAAQPTLPSAKATEGSNPTQRNAKPQPKPKASRAGGQQGRVSVQYVAACCARFIKQRAPHDRRTVSQTSIFLQLINCPAARLASPPRLSTHGKAPRGERGPVCVIVECSLTTSGIIAHLGEVPNTPPKSRFSFLSWWMGIRMRGNLKNTHHNRRLLP